MCSRGVLKQPLIFCIYINTELWNLALKLWDSLYTRPSSCLGARTSPNPHQIVLKIGLLPFISHFIPFTFQGTNISHLWEKENHLQIYLGMGICMDMLVPWRVIPFSSLIHHQLFRIIAWSPNAVTVVAGAWRKWLTLAWRVSRKLGKEKVSMKSRLDSIDAESEVGEGSLHISPELHYTPENRGPLEVWRFLLETILF